MYVLCEFARLISKVVQPVKDRGLLQRVVQPLELYPTYVWIWVGLFGFKVSCPESTDFTRESITPFHSFDCVRPNEVEILHMLQLSVDVDLLFQLVFDHRVGTESEPNTMNEFFV